MPSSQVVPYHFKGLPSATSEERLLFEAVSRIIPTGSFSPAFERQRQVELRQLTNGDISWSESGIPQLFDGSRIRSFIASPTLL